ncbi:MAG: spore germination protein [Dethiobacter sp.]|jgi:spore germination protein KA|nr:spore germination protein [Dethiobacter sp.]
MNNAFFALAKKIKKKIKRRTEESRPKKEKTKSELAVSDELKQRLQAVKDLLGESKDIVIREFKSGNDMVKLAILFIDGMSDKATISETIIRPIQSGNLSIKFNKDLSAGNALAAIEKHLSEFAETSTVPDLSQAVRQMLGGDSILLIDGEKEILVFGTRSWQSRAVEEPATESVVRGPREGFTETMRVNTSLLRRRIRHEGLRFESMKAGRRTWTEIVLVYIDDIVNRRVLEEVRRRIAAIDTDSILESGYIEEFIEDSPWSVFPQIEHTERVDKAAAAILEGRVLILTDNTPFTLIIPTSFFQFIQAAEDFYERPAIGATLLRLLRIAVLQIALMLPAIYVAVTTFHHEMLPTSLLLSIAAAREGIPFPAVAEALLMEATFEVLREAGIRLPRPVGQAISIVGGLVVGDAAIRAGLVSPAMVIVVATTAISSFAIPAFNASISLRLLRFPLLILAGVMGLYGLIFGLLLILIHLSSLQSFGIPYLAPLVHGTADDAIQTFARIPWWMSFKRPRMLNTRDRVRQKSSAGFRPAPPDERELFHEEVKKNAGKR